MSGFIQFTCILLGDSVEIELLLSFINQHTIRAHIKRPQEKINVGLNYATIKIATHLYRGGALYFHGDKTEKKIKVISIYLSSSTTRISKKKEFLLILLQNRLGAERASGPNFFCV